MAVRAELTRLLESAAFRTSKRCREFLGYIVEHTINGPSGALKERSIGVEIFQLPQDFDTGQHAVVRVTANEVRKKLAQHYLAENGSSHPVRIELPLGSYSAEFRWETPAVEAQIPTSETPAVEAPVTAPPTTEAPQLDIAAVQVPPGPRWRTGRLIAYAAAVIVIAGAALAWRSRAVKPISVDAKSPAVAVPPSSVTGVGAVRMMAGSASPYVDRSGRTWDPDRFSSGGNVLARPAERILRTLDPNIYRHQRSGDFRYDIPLQPGSYELHLHFAETGLGDFISAESSGEGQRLFRVFANGKQILNFFDVVADADGSNVADQRVFRNISPADDGFLHLSFASMRSTAVVNGIEVVPVGAGKVRPVRIRAGWTSSWQDSGGQQWEADSYFLGGNALVRTTNPAQQSNSMAPDMELYASERWGHFSYAVPVAEGRYRVTLKFCEGHYGRRNSGVGGVGSRVFDVYCNGVALLRDFDIFKEAGGEGRPLGRTFSGIRPNAQGKILLSFVPTNGMACVNGIEVVEDFR
ncbi:MAG: malectin domain-containing carbohydrate-binding protein [Bryobacteraceae bacterium]